MKVILSVFALILISIPARAVELHFCNRGHIEVDLFVATYETHLLSDSGWNVKGFYPVKGGDCTTIYASDKIPSLRLGFMAVKGGITYFAKPSTSGVTKSTLFRSSGSSLFSADDANLCLPDSGPFEYILPEKAATTCGKGWSIGQFGLKFYEDSRIDVYNVEFPFNIDAVLVPEKSGANDAPPVKPPTGNISGGASVLETYVKEDLAEYLVAAQSGFEQYKMGTLKEVTGHQIWEARKPLMANSCYILKATTNTLVCQLSHFDTLRSAEDGYAKLLTYVASDIPTWTRTQNPFGSEIKSMGFVSPDSNLEGEIWLHSDPGQSTWSLHYQLFKRDSSAK